MDIIIMALGNNEMCLLHSPLYNSSVQLAVVSIYECVPLRPDCVLKHILYGAPRFPVVCLPHPITLFVPRFRASFQGSKLFPFLLLLERHSHRWLLSLMPSLQCLHRESSELLSQKCVATVWLIARTVLYLFLLLFSSRSLVGRYGIEVPIGE